MEAGEVDAAKGTVAGPEATYGVELLAVDPYPNTTQPIQGDEYVVTLLVTVEGGVGGKDWMAPNGSAVVGQLAALKIWIASSIFISYLPNY